MSDEQRDYGDENDAPLKQQERRAWVLTDFDREFLRKLRIVQDEIDGSTG